MVGVSQMNIRTCLNRSLPMLLAAMLAAPVPAQDEDEREVRARATWRPQAPELKELPPGVRPEREEFKVERPEAQLPGFKRPESGLATPDAPEEPARPQPSEVKPQSATAAEAESAPPAPEDTGDEALRQSAVESTQSPATVDVSNDRAERTMPQPLSSTVVQPKYPADALVDGVEGYVTLEFTVTDSGNVTDVAIAEAQPEGVFEEAVREAIRRWRFEPARENGKPVDQRVRHRFDFTLEGG